MAAIMKYLYVGSLAVSIVPGGDGEEFSLDGDGEELALDTSTKEPGALL